MAGVILKTGENTLPRYDDASIIVK